MSLDDFCALTPDEFTAVCTAYGDKAEADMHGDWERMRMLATITIQPHIKGKMTPDRLLPFPWEKKREDVPIVGKDEAKARFEALISKNTAAGVIEDS